ncbi:DUF2264 domain-containing protein [Dactylosporangium fulvum]|uniref:DUF2264 domain-containing protein n=1 Tax=Dactylosporangium fulvum TaxID=53359 RepID=A0ABY5VQN2_9ACTN|nr:DUF2264 domain-containing protein [Dactylosporangium fulvum]UWP80033.1 DUF2264 domain-containing protein [Dactylosporangium fulvum]
MSTLAQLHGTLSTDPTDTHDGWAHALLAVTAPATRLAALGPDRQPVSASSNDPGATWLELVARPLWGLAAHAAGGGRADEQWHDVRRSLLAALNPRHDWYAGPPGGQRLVESAAIGYALAIAPRELWDPLTGRDRDVLVRWLSAATQATPHDNNWHFFPVLAGLGLERLGIATDATRRKAHLDRLERFALSDGWYSDGDGGGRDYYNPFAFHWYGLVMAGLDAFEPERAERLTERSRRFAEQFQHWFAADGSSVPFGRSLGYRFAQGAFWGALAFADLPALPWQRIRALADRHLAWWWRRPIASEDGLLTVGYGYPNSSIVEQYLGAGSPYWSTKFFLPLALPTEHPFWSSATTAEAGPADAVSVQVAPRVVISRHRGDVVLLNGQGWRDWARGGAAKYAKFAYSTRAGFSVPAGDRSLAAGAFDSMLALSDDAGRRWRAREEVDESRIDGHVVWTRWSPWADVTVQTYLAPFRDGWHLRLHRLTTGRALTGAEGAFSLPWTALGQDAATLRSTGDVGTCGAAADGLNSVILDLDTDRVRTGELVAPIAGTNVLHPRTVLPMLRSDHPPGEHRLRTAVYLGDEPPRLDDETMTALRDGAARLEVRTGAR